MANHLFLTETEGGERQFKIYRGRERFINRFESAVKGVLRRDFYRGRKFAYYEIY